MYGSWAFFHTRNATWAVVIADKMFLNARMSTVAENLSGDRLELSPDAFLRLRRRCAKFWCMEQRHWDICRKEHAWVSDAETR